MASDTKSPIAAAIQKGLAARDLNSALNGLKDVRLSTATEAHAVADALLRIEGWPAEAQIAAVEALCPVMQKVNSREAVDVLRAHAMTRLAARFESLRRSDAKNRDRLLFALKIMALFQYVAAAPLIVSAIRAGFESDNWFWTVAFGAMEHCRELRMGLCGALTDPLPSGIAAVAFLDMANATWMNDESHVADMRHPFDSVEGWERLERWLISSDERYFSYARSATSALPFISCPTRDQLLALALAHADPRVQIEAAWVSARLGSESGIRLLTNYCTDVYAAVRAARLLDELGRSDAIPPEMHDPDFMATATMCNWLDHAFLAGLPDSISLLDSRELHWPPTNQRLTIWVFQLRYGAPEAERASEIAFGLVGGINPAAYFNEIEPKWPHEDMYALHCSRESTLDDSVIADKPERYSVEHGHMLLRRANPDWP